METFFHELALAVDYAPDFPTLVERSLMHAHRAVAEHVVLQKVLETEPERLLPQLTQSAGQVQEVLRDYLADKLRSEPLLPGVDPVRAGDWLARMGLSFILAEGGWDLSDPDEVRRLVRGELLPPILIPEALAPT